MKNLMKLLLCLLACCALAGVAQAQQGACGALDAATDGLCHAYCEDLDCDADAAGGDLGPRGTVDACVAVFDAHKQLAGTAPPCEPDLVCPCYAGIGYFGNLIDRSDGVKCTDDGSTTSLLEPNEGIWVRQGKGSACGDQEKGVVRQELAITWEEAEQCRLLIEKAAAGSKQPCS